MKKGDIKVNAFLNTAKTVLGIIFPLITFPYVSRVLQVDAIGIYNFSASINSYFLLIAGLGVCLLYTSGKLSYTELIDKYIPYSKKEAIMDKVKRVMVSTGLSKNLKIKKLLTKIKK